MAASNKAEADKQAKTDKMNGLLNDVVPYFRCGDKDVVRMYYFLWSVYLMLYIDVGRGLETYPLAQVRAREEKSEELRRSARGSPAVSNATSLRSSQSAANNFLGIHRFDAAFQIRAGAWTNPARHEFYANGNVLIWENALKRGLNETNMLPDNMGIDWGSTIFGNEVNIHIIGAPEIYEHSGDRVFFQQAYDFYKSLYWNDMFWVGNCFSMAYDAILALNKMAEVPGLPEDAARWSEAGGAEEGA